MRRAEQAAWFTVFCLVGLLMLLADCAFFAAGIAWGLLGRGWDWTAEAWQYAGEAVDERRARRRRAKP